MDLISELRVVLQVALAMVFGAFIGWDRERQDRPAGIRTHMLVAGTGCLLYGIVQLTLRELPLGGETHNLRMDPFRVLEALVTGIAFIGAGTIFFLKGKERVKGLTTAASLLICGAIGLAVGMTHYLTAAGTTLLTFLTLHSLNRLEQRFDFLSGK